MYEATEEELREEQELRYAQLEREYGRYSDAELEDQREAILDAIEDERDAERWMNDYESDRDQMWRREGWLEDIEEEFERRRSLKRNRVNVTFECKFCGNELKQGECRCLAENRKERRFRTKMTPWERAYHDYFADWDNTDPSTLESEKARLEDQIYRLQGKWTYGRNESYSVEQEIKGLEQEVHYINLKLDEVG